MISNFRKNFPKYISKLNSEDQKIHDDFVKSWLQELNKKKYNLIENFNHEYSVNYLLKSNLKSYINTLELGCGIGSHLNYENLNSQNYHVADIRENVLNEVKKKNKDIKILLCDVQKKMSFNDGYFDRVNAIHILEHLHNLPSCIDEVHRLLNFNGIFQVVIPCDPGFIYKICRNISAKRIFEKKYKKKYDTFIKREHINTPYEIMGIIEEKFEKIDTNFFPFKIPLINLNLCIGLTYRKI